MKYDLIIIGAGPAGVAAAIYAKRSGLNILLIEKNMVGGLLNNINSIENYPGIKNISGPDLAFNMFEQLKNLNIKIQKEEVLEIKLEDNLKKVITNKDTYFTKYIILATGRANNKLDVLNADKFLHKGISYCAICDGNLYKNQEVCVVGGGDSAFQESLYLANICSKVTILIRKNKARAKKELLNRVKEIKNIEILYNSSIERLDGKDKLESVQLTNGNTIKCSALFVYIGFLPSLAFLDSLDIAMENNYLIVDNNYETSIEGIYAVGDNIKQKIYQIVTAASAGAVAATNVFNELKNPQK